MLGVWENIESRTIYKVLRTEMVQAKKNINNINNKIQEDKPDEFKNSNK